MKPKAMLFFILLLLLVSGCVLQPKASTNGTADQNAQPSDAGGKDDNAAQQAKVEVVKSYAYVNVTGFLKAFAEVKNTGGVPVKFVEVAFHYTDAEGNPVTNAKLASIRILNPGDSAPASITLDIGLSPESVAATIAGFDLSGPVPYDGIIAVKKELTKPGGYAKGSAYVENTGDIDWERGFAVTTTFFDAEGNVVETGVSFFPSGLKKGEKQEFSTTVMDGSPLGISDFKVQLDYKE